MSQPSPSSAPTTLSDADLLRRYEPVLRLTKGEAYFPSDVDRYVAHCSLWVSHANGADECIIPRGQLTLDMLAETRKLEPGAYEYLKFAENVTTLGEVAQRTASRGARTMALQRGFEPGVGRLARVGYLARLADAGISLSMLVRGRVPSATSAIAEQLTQEIQSSQPRHVYYGRVVRDGGWICLNYWFFYYYDDWRTGFDGVNDHEADWENLSVFLYETEGGWLEPQWVVFSCHDFTGDDLRRRWDDHEQLEIVGDTHPVAYVGAGSHAHYYRPGEYLIESEVPGLQRLEPIARTARRLWRKLFGDETADADENTPLFVIPFVEYARGDGLSIGPGQDCEWTLAPLDPAPNWLRGFHGMWGLFVRDPVGGENAPAGPMFNRDGQPRFSWFAPLAFAGVDRLPTPPQAFTALAARRDSIVARQKELNDLIQARLAEQQGLGAEMAAVAGLNYMQLETQAGLKRAESLRAELRQLRRERMDNDELIGALDARAEALKAGQLDDPRAHARIVQEPMKIAQLRFGRLAQLWSAASIGLLLIGLAAILILTEGRESIALIAVLVVTFVLVDSLFRRSLAVNATRIAMTLAVITAVLLIIAFWWPLLLLVVFGLGLYLAIDNLRDLWAALKRPKKS
jgi:hypothetical protein